MKRSIRTAGISLGIIALAGVAIGQPIPTVDGREEGTPRFDANQIVFSPGAGDVGLGLTVSGPDGYEFTKGYRPGVSPTFSVSGLRDGLYSYELRIVLALGTDDAERAGTKRRVVPPNERGLRKATMESRDTIAQSGHFTVKAGSIVTRDEVESSAVVERSLSESDRGDAAGGAGVTSPDKDFVINDDLIVDGSACIGFDCVNGESFGFDTIRIKENNLRIKADDTSVAASYPRNDWQLTFNDSANGGTSKFSVDDITGSRTPFTIEAGARSHSLYVDDGGRIGIRTSTPSTEIHVIDGDSPTLRLQQDGSSGFAPQTWDLAGNETNFFVRDVTNGSTLPFRIQPDAPSNVLTLKADGKVGIGTWAPDQELDIEADTPAIRLTATTSGEEWEMNVNASGRFNWNNNDTGNTTMRIDAQANNNLLNIGVDAANTVSVNGNITATGTITPDYVFGSDYTLESIEEHAAFMWSQRHLPAVAPGTVNAEGKAVINLTARAQGVLEELEKAHIYIEQLHATIQEMQIEHNAAVADLQNRLEKLESGPNE